MQNIKKQNGFAVIEIVMGVLLVAAIGVAGYFAYQAHTGKATTSSTTNKTQAKTTTTEPPAQSQNPLLYQDGDGSIYQLGLEAQTTDQKGIATALDDHCQLQAAPPGDTYVAIVGEANVFTAKSTNFTLDGNFASLNQGCYDKTKGGAQFGGGAVSFLKKVNDHWVFLMAGQEEADCSAWDGTGVPADIASSCYDTTTNTSRAPKP